MLQCYPFHIAETGELREINKDCNADYGNRVFALNIQMENNK